MIIAFGALGLLLLPMGLLAVLVRLTSTGSALYWSERVGRDNRIFRMPKFRTMRPETPVVATHLLVEPAVYLTPIGAWMRKTSLDELPQLLSVIKGDMSLVGPRPALFNQEDLIAIRTGVGVHRLTPGITGWAQINGRDELTIADKVRLDSEYMKRQSLRLDLSILRRTLALALRGRGVAH